MLEKRNASIDRLKSFTTMPNGSVARFAAINSAISNGESETTGRSPAVR
jgi:hypothetical protein